MYVYIYIYTCMYVYIYTHTLCVCTGSRYTWCVHGLATVLFFLTKFFIFHLLTEPSFVVLRVR